MRNAAGDHQSYKYLPAELTEAGIDVVKNQKPDEHPEVLRYFSGRLHGWMFDRAWYYWVASGPAIPMDLASAMHKLAGGQIRVAGHCGCPSPEEWYGNRGPEWDGTGWVYHIDTQVGLNIFANVLRLWVERDHGEALSIHRYVGGAVEMFIKMASRV